jgi:hypothetical protein
MRKLRSIVIGDRRISLWCDAQYWYVVRLEVRVEGVWHDISLPADQQLGITSANRRYTESVAAAQAQLQGAQTV